MISRLENVNLIHLFDFYLATMFVISLYRRRQVYWDAIRLGISTISRRKLLGSVTQHRDALLTTEVVRPVLLVIGLMTIQMLCSRVIFPDAQLNLLDIAGHWWRVLIILVMFLPMVSVDLYFLIRVGRFDRHETEKYLEQAETWLGWRASALRVVTLGIVNPKKIVAGEIRKGLRELGATVTWSMWWVSVQSGLRFCFGLTIWLLWVISLQE